MFKNLQIKSLLLLLVMALGSSVTAWAEDVFYTLTPAKGSNNNYANDCDVEIGRITWNITGNSQMNPWRIGGKSLTEVDRTVYSKTPMGANISKVDLTVGAASSITVHSLTLTVATDADFSNVVETVSASFAANSTITFSPTKVNYWEENAYYKFTFNVTVSGTSNKFVEFSEAKFYNAEVSGKEKIATIGDLTPTTVEVGTNGTFVLPITFAENATANDYSVAWTSSTDNILALNGSSYTANSAGKADVTVTVTPTNSEVFDAVSKTFTVTVYDPNAKGSQNNPFTVEEAITAINDGNYESNEEYYVKGIVSKFHNTSIVGDGANYRYYISDDGTEDNQLLVYKGTGLNQVAFSSADDLQLGDQVVVCGKLYLYNSTPEINSGNYIVSLVRKADPELSFSETEVEILRTHEDEFVAPTLSNPHNLTVVYSVENLDEVDVAQLKNNGTVSLTKRGVGRAVVTATTEETDEYRAGLAQYTIIISDLTDPELSVEDVTMEFDSTVELTVSTSSEGELAFGYDEESLVIEKNETTGKYELYALNIGEYVVSVSQAAAGIYAEANTEFTVNVTRKAATLEIADVTLRVGEITELQITTNVEGDILYKVTDETIANVEEGLVEGLAVGETTVSATIYGSGDLYDPSEVTVTFTVTVKKALAEGEVFYESFDGTQGKGGNDDSWSGSIANSTVVTDNEGWSFVKEGGADKCVKLGTGSNQGSATTPAIALEAGKYSLTFKAAAWNGNSEGTTLNLTATNATLSQSSVTLTKGKWTEYEVTLTVAEDADVNIIFAASVSSNNRFFLDEVSLVTIPTPEFVQYTITDAGWATFVPEYNVEVPQSVNAYIVTGTTDDTVLLAELLTIPAGEPVVLNGAPETHDFTVIDASNLLNDVDVATNKLRVSDGTIGAANNVYVLANHNEKVGFYKWAGGLLGAGRVYLPAEAAPAGARSFLGFGNGTSTGIEAVESVETSGSMFDLQGRRVMQPTKGLYIVGGKKVVLK